MNSGYTRPQHNSVLLMDNQQKEHKSSQDRQFEQTVKRMLATPPQPKNVRKDHRIESSDKTDHEQKLILPQ